MAMRFINPEKDKKPEEPKKSEPVVEKSPEPPKMYAVRLRCRNCGRVYPKKVDIPFGVKVFEHLKDNPVNCIFCGVFSVEVADYRKI